MRNRDGEDGTGHSLEEDRGALKHLHQGNAGFKLFGEITFKSRPMSRSGDEIAECSQHLTAVAYTESEGVFSFEEPGDGFAHLVLEKDGLGPAASRAQYIAI